MSEEQAKPSINVGGENYVIENLLPQIQELCVIYQESAGRVLNARRELAINEMAAQNIASQIEHGIEEMNKEEEAA